MVHTHSGRQLRSAALRATALLTVILGAATASSDESGGIGGIRNDTLIGYVEDEELWPARGTWYNIEAWAARTSNCAGNNSTTVCMACSQNMPEYAAEAGAVPIAVANKLWFAPQRGAVCSMCLKIFLAEGNISTCLENDYGSSPDCPGVGTQSYADGVTQPWAYSAKLSYDPVKQMKFFIGVIIEWYDRNQSLPYDLSYPVQGLDTSTFGSWPIQYEGVPCPVLEHKLAYQFLDVSKPLPAAQATNQTAWTNSGTSAGIEAEVASSLCNNEFDRPCGGTVNDTGSPPLRYLKFQVIGQRIPLSAVQLRLQDGNWYTLKVSGDGYWQPIESLSFTQDPNEPIDVKIFCSDGSAPKVDKGIFPSQMLCAYQDPECQAQEGSIQC